MSTGTSGHFSGAVLAPLSVLLVGAALSSAAFLHPTPPSDTVVTGPSTAGLSTIFTPEVQNWGASILRWAADSDLDPDLVASVMQIESCGDPFARSTAGAIGLFQVMPFHFAYGEDGFSPEINAARGMEYLRRSLSAADNDPRLALAGYNGGIGLIDSAESTWPAESSRYGYWGSGIYADAKLDASHSDRLAEWLAAGGASLCRAAARHLGLAD